MIEDIEDIIQIIVEDFVPVEDRDTPLFKARVDQLRECIRERMKEERSEGYNEGYRDAEADEELRYSIGAY